MWFKNIDPSKLKVKHNVLSWDEEMLHTMNKKSWHYKLATAGKDPWELKYFDEECDNFCKYARSVFNGILRYAGLGMAVIIGTCIVTYCVGDFIAWIWFMLWNMALVEPYIGATFIIIAVGFIAFFFISSLIAKAGKKTADAIWMASHNAQIALEKKDSGFIAMLYKKYKQKICFGVKYE